MPCDLLVILVLLSHISGSFLTSTMPEINVTVCHTSPNVMSWRVEDFPNPQTDRIMRSSFICFFPVHTGAKHIFALTVLG
jgi:hypothetical protein